MRHILREFLQHRAVADKSEVLFGKLGWHEILEQHALAASQSQTCIRDLLRDRHLRKVGDAVETHQKNLFTRRSRAEVADDIGAAAILINDKIIDTGPSGQRVVPLPSIEKVKPCPSTQRVGAAFALQAVGERTARQRIVAVAPESMIHIPIDREIASRDRAGRSIIQIDRRICGYRRRVYDVRATVGISKRVTRSPRGSRKLIGIKIEGLRGSQWVFFCTPR